MENTFPGFPHEASELSTYLVALDNFAIALKNKMVIRYTPADAAAFRRWLDDHHVTDITNEAGTLVLDMYANKK